jgi:hypothetical protein
MTNKVTGAPLLHIIIPTYRRPLKLDRLLASLEKQGYGAGGEVQITVSENGGSEGADAVVARWKGRLPVSYIHQPAPLGFLLHLATCYALGAGVYCWEIGDDDIIADVPWPDLRGKLAPEDLDALLLGHDFIDDKGVLHHDSGHKHLMELGHKYRGDCLDLVCASPSTFTLISAVIMRTSRMKQHLARSNAGGGFFPLELLLRVAEGGLGEYWPGDRVRGDLEDVSWAPSAQRYLFYDLPEMLARLARELPRARIEEAVTSIFRDRCVRWEQVVAYDSSFANWFYRRHGPAVEAGQRILGATPAIHELYQYTSLSGQCREISAAAWFRLTRQLAGILGRPRATRANLAASSPLPAKSESK